MTKLLNKIRGGLYGQALGDAFAMPAWLSPQATWDYYGGFITKFLDGPKDHPVHFTLKAGQITDDTEQAVYIAQEYIKDGKASPEAAARAIVKWYDWVGGEECPFVGPSSRRAITAIKRGEDIYKTGASGDTNGAAMRISVVGLMHPGDIDGAVADTVLTCIPSHNTNIAISGASAVAGAIAEALTSQASLQSIVDAAIQAAEMGLNHGNIWMGASTSKRIALAVKIARKKNAEWERIQELYDIIGTTFAITESVPAAFGILIMAGGDPMETARLGAALSGDADTIAAMACAIAGAYKGIDSFPKEIVETLNKANPWVNFEDLASQIYQMAKK
ncbi:MAG: ADP-ribosylglycohydrolase family protein [Anaerolineaceae bacterium]|nr:ADP-ribosylglycohydrolase family protein [Anaerolineaceae bacterium]